MTDKLFQYIFIFFWINLCALDLINQKSGLLSFEIMPHEWDRIFMPENSSDKPDEICARADAAEFLKRKNIKVTLISAA